MGPLARSAIRVQKETALVMMHRNSHVHITGDCNFSLTRSFSRWQTVSVFPMFFEADVVSVPGGTRYSFFSRGFCR